MDEAVSKITPEHPTAVGTDWSRQDLGHTLSQKHCCCPDQDTRCCPTGWKLVAFASRFTHPAERFYSPVEGECLSAAVGLRKFKHFVLGCNNLLLVVDHKPLVKLLGDKRLEDIDNMSLLKLKEKTMPFKFQVIHVPGIFHKTADAGSRYPCDPAELFLEDEVLAELVEEVEVELHAEILSNWEGNIKNVTWKMVKEASNADPTLSLLWDEIEQGLSDTPDICTIPEELKEYGRYIDSLSVQDGVILHGTRTVIPSRLRHRVLDTLHSAH